MSPSFFRFYNNIQLNSAVFVDNQGVSSLNLQEGDKDFFEANLRYPKLAVASNVVIKNGVLGLSSHAGIHGNGAKNVRIENVHVRDFEVAGIQCNGCVDVLIKDTVVGPSSTQVPALATFANARFLSFYTQRLIPAGFAREDSDGVLGLAALLDDTISFADRPGLNMSLAQIFERIQDAEVLFTADYLGTISPGSLSPDKQQLLAEAHRVFDNPSGLPDGSAVYGIFFNFLGKCLLKEPGGRSLDV